MIYLNGENISADIVLSECTTKEQDSELGLLIWAQSADKVEFWF